MRSQASTGAWVCAAAIGMAVLAVALAPKAHATVLEDLKLADLTARADVIVVGTIGEATALRLPGADQIWTDTALSVDQIVKGKVAPKLTIRQQGGRIGDSAMVVAGNAALPAGRRVVLFLKRQGDRFYTVGMELGAFEIYTGHDGQPWVRRRTTVPVGRLAPKGQMQLADPEMAYHGAPLQALIDDVRALLAAPPADAEVDP